MPGVILALSIPWPDYEWQLHDAHAVPNPLGCADYFSSRSKGLGHADMDATVFRH